MKLNNKGFAFSTMLYGVLSMIVLVLMLVFGLMKYYKDENFYYASEIEKNLNDCVFDEVALEKCYVSGGICDPTSYYACIGIHSNDTDSGVSLVSMLKASAVTSGDGLYVDENDSRKYVFRGNIINNYVLYAGLKWRIVSIEFDDSIKLIYPDYKELAWDSESVVGSDTTWASSSLKNYLENNFFAQLSETSKVVKMPWNAGVVYDTENKKLYGDCDAAGDRPLYCEETYDSPYYDGSSGRKGAVGLLTVSDYVNASLSDTCRSNVFRESCSSWLSSHSTWLLNPVGLQDKKAFLVDSSGNIQMGNMSSTNKVAPVMYIESMNFVSGDGSFDNPYVIR